jgi:hypothetical protein
MSGSGGSGYSGGFEPVDTCESLVIDTQISSPKSDVIEKIAVDDILDVALTQLGATTVVVVLHHGSIAGGVAAPQVQQLRDCIEKGTKYKATIISKNGGQVRIRIQPERTI